MHMCRYAAGQGQGSSRVALRLAWRAHADRAWACILREWGLADALTESVKGFGWERCTSPPDSRGAKWTLGTSGGKRGTGGTGGAVTNVAISWGTYP